MKVTHPMPIRLVAASLIAACLGVAGALAWSGHVEADRLSGRAESGASVDRMTPASSAVSGVESVRTSDRISAAPQAVRVPLLVPVRPESNALRIALGARSLRQGAAHGGGRVNRGEKQRPNPGDPVDPGDPGDPAPAPGAPSGVFCTSGDMKDRIAFSAPEIGMPDGYELWWSAEREGPFTIVATATADVREFVRSVDATGQAFYRVTASGADGRGEPSEVVDNSIVAIAEQVGPQPVRVVASNGEIILDIPAGAFSTTETVTIEEVSGSPTGGIISLAGVYRIEPSGPLGAPARLSIAYSLAVTHHEVSATLLKAASLLTTAKGDSTWVSGATDVRVENGFVSGSVDHFSPWFPGSPIPHGTDPEAAGYCDDVCHDISTYPGSSTRYDTRDSQVCFNCHGNPDPAADPYIGPDERNVQGEFAGDCAHPVALGDLYCTACHDPHASPSTAPSLLRSLDAATGRYVRSENGAGPGTAFCWTCHGIVRNRTIDYYVPGYYARTGNKQTTLAGTPHASLPDPNGNGIACSACHASHGSGSDALITEGPVEGREVTGNDQSLCRACHQQAVGGYSGEAIYAATAHSAVTASSVAATGWPTSDSAAGSCQNCHDPHGSANPDYLRASGRALCAGCHDVAGLSYPDDYSYRGPASFAASGHDGLTGSLGYVSLDSSTPGFAAWESTTASALGTPVDADGMEAIRSANGVVLSTALQTTTGESDYQTFRFKVPGDASGLSSVAFTWKGYGEAAPGYPVTIWAWDTQAETWRQMDGGIIGAPRQMMVNLTPANHVDAQGYVWIKVQARYVYDAAITSGPTITAPYSWLPTRYRIQWTTAGLASTEVQYGPTTSYGSTIGNPNERTVNHEVWFTPPAGITHLRVRSQTSFGESATSADYAMTSPRPTIASTNPSSLVWLDEPVSTTFTWNTLAAPGGPFEYRVQAFLGGSEVLMSGWTTATSYVFTTATPGSYSWRVEARDASGTSYGWSAAAGFNVADGNYTGSCPFLFTWDGTKNAFEADLFTAARIGGASATGFQQANPNDAYVLENTPVPEDGSFRFDLVEERYEVDYLDSYALYTVDAPAGTTLYAQKAVAGTRTFPPLASAVHTVRSLAPVESVIRTDTGSDVASPVSADDGVYLELNKDRETTFGYKTIELDLGEEAVTAPQVKIVMDAVTEFPVTPAGIARRFTFGLPSRLEVQDPDGTWRAVPASVGAVPVAPEFTRPYVFDLTRAIAGSTGRVRFTFLFRTLIDSIGVDLSADEPVVITPVPLTRAELGHHGVDEEAGTAGEARFEYGANLRDGAYLPGMYTRFGDVTELLTEADDRFVIMGQGDEISLSYAAPSPPAAGLERSYVVSVLGYYKDLKTDVARTVEPLPFAAMSNYPYTESEQYPADAEHEAYRAEYNTRRDGVEAPSAVQAVRSEAIAHALGVFHVMSSTPGDAVEPDSVAHRSLNTDMATLDVAFADASGAGGECGVCHAVHGAAEWGVALAGGRIASDGRTCTANGTGGCHDNAANSASGTDVRDQFTVNADPTAHHDVLPDARAASGGQTSCADCHNPHVNNGASMVSDPDDIAQPETTSLTSVVSASGEVYLLAGAKHDAIAPVISGVILNGAGTQYASPFVTWTTDEPSTSFVEWGPTTAYGEVPFGTDVWSTSHSVQMNGLVSGTTYHYRVRSTDALNNTSVSGDYTYTPIAPPPTPVIGDHTTYAGPGMGPISITATCTAVVAPDAHPVEYQFQFDGSTYYSSPWVSAPSWTSDLWFFQGTHTVCVRARDAVHTQAVSAWSAADSFTVTNASWPPSSCPFVFVWNGTGFVFEGDISTTGKLAEKTATGYSRPDPRDRYKLTTEPQLEDGKLEIRLVEERLEIDYTDELALFAIDLPQGVDVYAEKGVRGGPGAIPPDGLHTVTGLRTPVTVRTDTGEDVTDALSAVDGDTLVLNEDRERFEYKKLEMDLGDVSDAPQVKIVMHAQSARPLTSAGVALQRTFPATTRLEVQNLDGTWRAVPSSEAALPNAMEFPRSYVFEIGPAMHDTTGKVRFTFLFKTYIDMIGFDTSADLPISVTEVPLDSGSLAYHGIDARTSGGEVYDFVYGEPASTFFFPPGYYTRYGDVTPLLGQADDEFVIWGPGDELTLRFEPLAAPQVGAHREYVLFSETYYKSQKSDTPFEVEPLPFAAMSNYPYPDTESYPADAEHLAYRAEWNTRGNAVETGGTAGSAMAWLSYHVTRDEGRFSVDTDFAALRAVAGTTATWVQPAEGWQCASAEGLKPDPWTPGEPVGAATLDAADVDDASYWRTDEASTDGEWNWQMMRFDLGADALDTLRALSVVWNGHGEPSAGYQTAVFIWNPADHTWEELSRFVSGSDRAVSVERRALSDVYCLKCHDGTPPSGVVFPPATRNVGATWSAVSGDFHGGGSGTGLGSALLAPYARGNSAISCGTCHETHGSANVYHFPTWINGTSDISVPAPTGPGTALVCGSCHVSGGASSYALVDEYHDGCVDCHRAEHGQWTFVGTDCLSCHKHGGTWDHYANIDQDYYNSECHCGVPGPYKTF